MTRIDLGPLRRAPIFALAVVTLASCATVPATSISSKGAAEGFRARSLDDQGLRKFVARADPGRGAWPPVRPDGRALALAASGPVSGVLIPDEAVVRSEGKPYVERLGGAFTRTPIATDLPKNGGLAGPLRPGARRAGGDPRRPAPPQPRKQRRRRRR